MLTTKRERFYVCLNFVQIPRHCHVCQGQSVDILRGRPKVPRSCSFNDRVSTQVEQSTFSKFTGQISIDNLIDYNESFRRKSESNVADCLILFRPFDREETTKCLIRCVKTKQNIDRNLLTGNKSTFEPASIYLDHAGS